MCSLSGILGTAGTGMQVAGTSLAADAAYDKSVAQAVAYTTQAQVAENNAGYDEMRASDAIARGKADAGNVYLKGAALKGQQIASFAARGIGGVTPNNILTDTVTETDREAAIIHDNAAKEAWGYRVAEQNDKSNADLLRYRAGMENPDRAKATTLLTGAGAVAKSWYNLGKSADSSI